MKQKDVIKNISGSQREILEGIIKLYCPEGFDADVTYSKGNFYDGIPKPKYKFDLNPQFSDVVKSDCRNLPLPDDSLKSLVIDLPFMPTTPVTKTNNNIMHKRFSYVNGVDNLYKLYFEALDEIYRVLREDGVCIFKCQNFISSGKQHLIDVNIVNYACSIGFYPIDRFIFHAKNRPISGKHKNQKHSRNYTSMYLIFVKQKSPVMYPYSHQKLI